MGLSIAFDHALFVGSNPRSWDLQLDVVADIVVTVDEVALFVETDFPIVEFALSLRRWKKDHFALKKEYVYTSQETDETGWIWFRAVGPNVWFVGSGLDHETAHRVSGNELLDCVTKYLSDVEEWGKTS